MNNILTRIWRKGKLHCCKECKLVRLLWKTVRQFLKKLKIEPAVLLLSIYLNETENTYLKRHMHPQCS